LNLLNNIVASSNKYLLFKIHEIKILLILSYVSVLTQDSRQYFFSAAMPKTKKRITKSDEPVNTDELLGLNLSSFLYPIDYKLFYFF
jgi:hypothetical protein